MPWWRRGDSTSPACTRSHTTEGRRAAQSGSCTAPRRTSTCCGSGWPLLASAPADAGLAPKLAAMLPFGSGATTAAWLSGSCTAGRPLPLPAGMYADINPPAIEARLVKGLNCDRL